MSERGTLYPPIEPYASGMRDVGDGHMPHWERCGTAGMAAQREGARLLCIIGSDQDDKVFRIRPGKIKIGCSTDIHHLISKQHPYHRLHVTRNYFRQQRRPELSDYSCLLNLITEPENNQRVLENVRKILRDLPGKVINPPEAVLQSTRDQVARRLAGIPGLIVPKAVRLRTAKPAIAAQAIERAGMQFPIILRKTGTHTGRILGRFDEIGELRAALIDGAEHIATEFIDFRSTDGLYRKYRVFFFGRQRVLRHMLVSDNWNIHGKDRKRFMTGRPDFTEVERRLFAKPEGAFPDDVIRVLMAIGEQMPLDFFGIDFGFAPDGRVILFEANATMNFFPLSTDPQFAYTKSCVEPARLALLELLGFEPNSPTHPLSAADPELAR